jgi:CubicO group peptidase (beta-lactamase class C family)
VNIKKIALRTLFVVGAFAALGAAGMGIVYLMHEPIPDLAKATTVDSRIYDERFTPVINDIRSTLDEHRQTLTAPSISLAVAVNGELVWAEARGYADLESQQAATLDTTYLIGSVS